MEFFIWRIIWGHKTCALACPDHVICDLTAQIFSCNCYSKLSLKMTKNVKNKALFWFWSAIMMPMGAAIILYGGYFMMAAGAMLGNNRCPSRCPFDSCQNVGQFFWDHWLSYHLPILLSCNYGNGWLWQDISASYVNAPWLSPLKNPNLCLLFTILSKAKQLLFSLPLAHTSHPGFISLV